MTTSAKHFGLAVGP